MDTITFSSVSFAFDANPVLENATFSIGPLDFVSIIGPNGGGKTTMLKLMLGLLQPQKGTILLLGDTPQKNRTRVGYTPQYLSVDFAFPITVLDVVLMGRMQGNWSFVYRRSDIARAVRSLELLQLESLAYRPFKKLSGGERQRVLIARALCSEPEILLLDEPTNNIDAVSEQILFRALANLNKRMTVVVVSHDIGFVSQYVKRVLCVNRTVAVHTPSQMSGANLAELYGSHDIQFVKHDGSCCQHCQEVRSTVAAAKE